MMPHEAEDKLLFAERMLELRLLDEARRAFDDAEQMGAAADRCASGRWMTAMLGGDLCGAWRESEAIRGRLAPDPHRFWQGERLAGTRVVVRCLHGLGDAVQMLRYAQPLRAVAAQVIYEVPPELLTMAPYFCGVDEAITWGEDAPANAPVWDIQAEVMELPYIFRSRLDDLPVAASYLRIPVSAVCEAARSMGAATGLRVGLVWASGRWSPKRSLDFAQLGPLLAEQGAEFWSLQGGAAAAEAAGRMNLRDANDVCGEGLLALAATIMNLDLVITVDTLAAHLAGAMGKPAWVLLRHAADWRWMTGRGDSPWYPSLRLFRQERPGDWVGVIEAVRASLQALAAEWAKWPSTLIA